jgi:mannose-6-phosphate isomerase-like protein (cupin superfamily)
VSSDDLQNTYLRLRPDCSIEKLPVDEKFWPRLIGGELGDFHHEYLVTSHSHSADWPNWEMHPNGDEIVALMSGAATMILEAPDGQRRDVVLNRPGSYAFVPRGTWHTAQVREPTTMLFITPGEGTQHRQR